MGINQINYKIAPPIIDKILSTSHELRIKTLFKAIIIKVAKGLIGTSIYPTQDEFKNETERVVEQSHP